MNKEKSELIKTEKYTKMLEGVIKRMIRPLKKVPFKLVIETLSGHKIIPFDSQDQKDKIVLEKLIEVAITAGKKINKTGIKRPRPNEVGNDIEPIVKSALTKIKYKADTPKTKNGSKKTTGYPDIEFIDEFDRTNYLECKTYNIESLDTTFRSFYLSPAEEFKITKDAHHFIISFEIYIDKKQGKMNIYKCKAWKIIKLEELMVDVKYEFNADNSRLYSKDLILAEGKL
jgi:hypothetical protein